MKKPYLKKYEVIGKFTVWIVDGNYIRTNMDEEFTNLGQHYQFKFIPENEFWIDEEHGEGSEKRFFIQNMLIMNKLISQGVEYKRACKIADAAENRERSKSKFFEEFINGYTQEKELINKIHKHLLKKYSAKLKIWVVRGEIVRDLFFIDFTEGGHDKVYHFIPRNEVWIDDDLGRKEIKFVLLHELHERKLMAKGMDYDSAHHLASKIEYQHRHTPNEVDKAIEKELKENEKISNVAKLISEHENKRL